MSKELSKEASGEKVLVDDETGLVRSFVCFGLQYFRLLTKTIRLLALVFCDRWSKRLSLVYYSLKENSETPLFFLGEIHDIYMMYTFLSKTAVPVS